MWSITYPGHDPLLRPVAGHGFKYLNEFLAFVLRGSSAKDKLLKIKKAINIIRKAKLSLLLLNIKCMHPNFLMLDYFSNRR